MRTEKPITETTITERKYIELRLNKTHKRTSTAYQIEKMAAYFFTFLEKK